MNTINGFRKAQMDKQKKKNEIHFIIADKSSIIKDATITNKFNIRRMLACKGKFYFEIEGNKMILKMKTSPNFL